MQQTSRTNLRKEIKYVGFYDLKDPLHRRASAISAINKMDYICEALDRAGYDVHLISPSWLIDFGAGWAQKKTIHLSSSKKLTLCPSFGTTNRWALYLKIIYSMVWLLFFLILHTKKEEKVLVYHSPWLSLPVRIAKYLKKFKVILEVEEIYADVSSLNNYFDVLEQKLINSADSFIFSTELLQEKIRSEKKRCILYGVYNIAEKLSDPCADGKIHLLYAGIIDFEKRGAFNAIESTPYLPETYVLHVIGFGDTESLCKRIDELNLVNKCKIIFDGLKSGDDYLKYAQGCHIGLNTQKMDGKYLETSFPSKILSYFSVGLRVVSCSVDCVAKSTVHSLVNYYYSDTPQAIAQAILSVDLAEGYNSKAVMIKLDKQFVGDLSLLLNTVE